jgi:glucose/arabinose dehydrogenase
MKKSLLFVLIILVMIVVLGFLFRDNLMQIAFAPQDSDIPTGVVSNQEEEVQVVAENLSVPWDVAFLPEGGILVTEREGNLVHINEAGEFERISVPEVRATGESGLLGMALHPDFEENSFMYLYLTTLSGAGTINRVERFTLGVEPLSLGSPEEIISGIPGAAYHDGGRIRFGPNGYLYITTGDAGVEGSAQDLNSLAGKILRLNDDGGFPADNPFFRGDHELSIEAGFVYSFGHRNPQGLAWDDKGRLWSTEHGRSGVRSGLDELNLIEKGMNYGWPVIEGDEVRDGMRTPVIHSGASETWAPASTIFHEGIVYWGGLRGEGLYAVNVEGTKVSNLMRFFPEEYGRIRTVVLGPDGYLYFTTSNTDGRGEVRPEDDKLFRVSPSILE